eukprot:g1989.t1
MTMDQPPASRHLAYSRYMGHALPWRGKAEDGMVLQGGSFGKAGLLAQASQNFGSTDLLSQRPVADGDALKPAMVYLSDFQDFETAAQELFKQQPLRTRYLVKYRHKEGKVVLKVTNDRVCLKFKSELIANLKHIERFTQNFARWTATKDLSRVDEPDAELEDAAARLVKEGQLLRDGDEDTLLDVMQVLVLTDLELSFWPPAASREEACCALRQLHTSARRRAVLAAQRVLSSESVPATVFLAKACGPKQWWDGGGTARSDAERGVWEGVSCVGGPLAPSRHTGAPGVLRAPRSNVSMPPKRMVTKTRPRVAGAEVDESMDESTDKDNKDKDVPFRPLFWYKHLRLSTDPSVVCARTEDSSKDQKKDPQKDQTQKPGKFKGRKGRKTLKSKHKKDEKKEQAKKRSVSKGKTGSKGPPIAGTGLRTKKRKHAPHYSGYLFKVLKQVHPEVGISKRGMNIMNSFMNDIFDRIATESTKLLRMMSRRTLSGREVQTSVRLLLPGELAKHAVSEGTKSVNKFFNQEAADENPPTAAA